MELLKRASLFRSRKDDPHFLADQEKVRHSLLKNLSRAIKEVQLVHATQGEGRLIGDCRATLKLCARFEEVLRHALKPSLFSQSVTFWPVVLQVSRRQAIEYITSLQYAQSEDGRCRAWIRLAVNECSLESYITILSENLSLLSKYYELHSFLRDGEMVCALRQVLAGLSQLAFNITVDTASLEFEAAPDVLQPPLKLKMPQEAQDKPGHKHHRHRPYEQAHNHAAAEESSEEDDESSVDSESEEEEEEEEGGADNNGLRNYTEPVAMENSDPVNVEEEEVKREVEREEEGKEGMEVDEVGIDGRLCSSSPVYFEEDGEVREEKVKEEGLEMEGDVRVDQTEVLQEQECVNESTNPFSEPSLDFTASTNPFAPPFHTGNPFDVSSPPHPTPSTNPFIMPPESPPPTTSGATPISSLESSLPSDYELSTSFEQGTLVEDYYSPEMSKHDLEVAISKLIVQVKGGQPDKKLREKLVHLQIKLQKMKEDSQLGDYEEVLGHKLFSQPRSTPITHRGFSCEACGKRIHGIIKSWYRCSSCQGTIHKGCLKQLSRPCITVGEEVKYILEVCPEKGLTQQHFRCTHCNKALYQTPSDVRQCDYSGLYYCVDCHHNDATIIPARVLHNWDFTQHRVCCVCSDMLERLSRKPLLSIRDVNPKLYTYVEDLATIETLRLDLLSMKEYFSQCRLAKEEKLLEKLNTIPHCKGDARLFSLHDLADVHSGRLLPQMQELHQTCAQHIRKECPICSGKGYICELCSSDDVLFPFDRNVATCPACRTVFHRECFSEVTSCPKCLRYRRSSGHRI